MIDRNNGSNENMRLENDVISSAIRLARESGKCILDLYNLEDCGVDYKADNSPLTEADLKSDQILKEGLVNVVNCPYLSEESSEFSFADRCQWPSYWLVDPLDGTKEFLNKTGEFTVNIALIINGEPEFGIVYAPALDLMYYGIKNIGSFLQKKQETPLQLPLRKASSQQLNIVMSRSHADKETLEYISDKLGYVDNSYVAIKMGSSLKFCLLAEGVADLYPRLGPTQEWDTAAAHAVLKFSGGAILDLKTKNQLAYNKNCLKNNAFIAIAPQVFQERDELVKKIVTNPIF